MSNIPTPPPLPPLPTPPPAPYERSMSYGSKIILLGLQCFVLMIGTLVIWNISYSREERNLNVSEQIASEWGKPVRIQGPAAKAQLDSAVLCRPETYFCTATVETKSLHRNIYEAEVFNAHVSLKGTFCKDSIAMIGDSIFLQLRIPTRQLTEHSALKMGGQTVKWNRSDEYLFSEVDVTDMPQVIEFSTDFDIRGSGSLFVRQIGDKSVISIEGEASNPSFRGSSLPDERSLVGRTFSARWQSDEAPIDLTSDDDSWSVGTNFLVGVDRYQKVERSLKYAFLIIVLTFISVLFAEIMLRRNIPLLNYFLIGAALIIFYILLLSFSEHMSFGFAYTIASVMTVLLIAGYMWMMLGSRKVGIVIGSILTAMYTSCYILLTLETYALLLGSLLLFAALAAMMYGSLQIRR